MPARRPYILNGIVLTCTAVTNSWNQRPDMLRSAVLLFAFFLAALGAWLTLQGMPAPGAYLLILGLLVILGRPGLGRASLRRPLIDGIDCQCPSPVTCPRNKSLCSALNARYA